MLDGAYICLSLSMSFCFRCTEYNHVTIHQSDLVCLPWRPGFLLPTFQMRPIVNADTEVHAILDDYFFFLRLLIFKYCFVLEC